MINRTNARSLRQQFPGEYNCWKGMKQRLKVQGIPVDRKFRTFDQFMEIMGPKENPEDTLDRIDHRNPRYTPENVRWASKSLQARNRKNTVFLKYTGTKYGDHAGQTLSLTEWSAISKQNATTMRGRKRAGWSANEIIDGARASSPKTFEDMTVRELLDYRPWDASKENYQEAGYREQSYTDEDRFEFKLRVVQKIRLADIRDRHKSTAYFMLNEDERDEYERRMGGFDGVDGDWGRKPGSSNRAWKQLLAEYEAWQEQDREIKSQHRKWLAALRLASAARSDSKIALRKRNALRKRYVSGEHDDDGFW